MDTKCNYKNKACIISIATIGGMGMLCTSIKNIKIWNLTKL
jgi:hypothetical protein